MHNNFYFLRQLTQSLGSTLKDCVISECFCQNKEELIIRFETQSNPFFIKASVLASFSCLSFPDQFHRARKNSVDLFQELIGQRVASIRQFENERSVALVLSNDYALLFKMHGNRSNVILFKEGKVIDLFRNNIVEDGTLLLDALDRQIDWSHQNFIKHQDALPTLYFTFGKIVWRYLNHAGFATLSLDQKWKAIQNLLELLEHPTYFITLVDTKQHLSLVPLGDVIAEVSDPFHAINQFFQSFAHHDALVRERLSLHTVLKSKLQASENYQRKTQDKLTELENNANYKTWGDLIMANMHAIKIGTERITLPDFYQENHMIEIKLKKDVSPQKNAEIFYKKSKNQQQEVNRLTLALAGKQKEIETLTHQLQKLEQAEDLKGIRLISVELGLNKPKEKQEAQLPYHAFEHQGFKIWVGRNAQSNDVLTLKFGYKDDLWLHAKDVAGSHVLIKHQAGKDFPKEVIERAAQLAAYNSKRKTDTLCPVSVTPRKFVRKRKGDPAGAVVVEREDVILVEPKL